MTIALLSAISQASDCPLRWRIIALLAAAEADRTIVRCSQRGLAEALGADRRNVRREITQLLADGRLDRLALRGSAATLYRLRPIDEWGARWQRGRPAALALAAASEAASAAARARFAASGERPQTPFVGVTGAPTAGP